MTSIQPPPRAHMMSESAQWQEWESHLPAVLANVERRWGVSPEEAISRRVTSQIFRVTVRGREAVLKLARPSAHLSQQATILERARGEGYAYLFERADDLGALLMEPLGASLEARGEETFRGLSSAEILARFPQTELVRPLVDTLQVAWTLPHDLAAFPDEHTHKAAQLRDLIDELADKVGASEPHSNALARARLYAEQRLSAREASQLVLCHGDPHPGNLLAVPSPRPGAATGYVWVDPDGFLCEAEYDLGVVLRGFNTLILAADDPVVDLRAWCAVLANLTGTDAEAIWQWAFLERVTSGLFLIDQGFTERGHRYLRAASWLIDRKRL